MNQPSFSVGDPEPYTESLHLHFFHLQNEGNNHTSQGYREPCFAVLMWSAHVRHYSYPALDTLGKVVETPWWVIKMWFLPPHGADSMSSCLSLTKPASLVWFHQDSSSACRSVSPWERWACSNLFVFFQQSSGDETVFGRTGSMVGLGGESGRSGAQWAVQRTLRPPESSTGKLGATLSPL